MSGRPFETSRHSSFALALIALTLLGGSSCGTHQSHDVAPTKQHAGSGSDGGSDSAVATGTLADQTAGNECGDDHDCGHGMCLSSLATLGGAMMQAPGGYCSLACMSDVDCGAGGTCSGAFAGIAGIGAMTGQCLKSCSDASDCRDGYRCVTVLGTVMNGAATQDPTGGLLGGSGCQPVPATDELTNGIVGSPCTQASDCGQGRCETDDGMVTYPGGYCTGACLQDTDCGSNGSCTVPAAGGGAGTCYRNCGSDADCRDGYRCRANSGLKQCLPGAAPLPDHTAGTACTTDAECGGAVVSCASSLGGMTAPGGYCSQSCLDDSDCGAGGSCAGGFVGSLASLVGAIGSCYRICSDASACRKGYTCGHVSNPLGAPSSQNVCMVMTQASSEDAGVD